MHIKRHRGWDLPERLATSEALVLGRRALLGGMAGTGIAGPAAAQFLVPKGADAAAQARMVPLAARDNPTYVPGRALTAEGDAVTYNNYYEFNDSKNLWRAAQMMKTDPWSIEITGMVAKPRRIALEDLLRQVSLEQRVYRHRCVEAWAMTVPWIGFPLADLVKLADPLGSAKYVTFTSATDPKSMHGLDSPYYSFPYQEAVTIAEANNEVAFLSVGMYGKTLPPQNGAPIRLTLPWKYGFKQAKAIVKIGFTDKRPTSFWENLAPSEYGFWANVNPAVPHPRWSQARERLLGNDEMVPTQIWNGYGAYVASLYDGLKSERLFA